MNAYPKQQKIALETVFFQNAINHVNIALEQNQIAPHA
jgi:hypothetical protein